MAVSNGIDNWPVAALEHRGNHVAINQRALQLLRLEAQEPLGDPIARLVAQLRPPHQERFQARWHQGRINQQPWRCDVELKPGCGASWLRIDAQLQCHEHWTLTLIDISDLIHPQEPSGHNDLARTALNITEAIPVGTYTMVLRPGAALASFEFMSERFLQLTGLDRATALADPLKGFACVHPDDYDAWVQLNAEAFEKKTPFYGETRLVVNGELRWISAESVPRNLADGSTVWEGVLIDITERIQAQQELKQQQDQLERILNNIPVAIVLQQLNAPDKPTSFLNASFRRNLGYTLADIPTQEHWARLAYPDPIYRQQVFSSWDSAMSRAMAQQGTVEQGEYRVQTKDGRALQLLISAVVLDDTALVAMVDVTSHREAERRRLRDTEDKLRVSLSASAVGHEIRQPLSAILLNSQLALEELNSEPTDLDKLRNQLQPMAEQARQMAVICERISLLLRNVETEKVDVDLVHLVRGAVLQQRPNLRSSPIALRCELPEQPMRLKGDPVQLQLAIANLLRNGIEALHQAAPEQPTLHLRLQQQGPWIELAVADNGPGFAPDHDPLEPLNTRKSEGCGIGLYVAQLSMQNHSGRIHCGRSATLGGAEVILQLPAQDGSQTI